MGKAQGKKVDPSAVAAQAIEAQPSFGQIKAIERPGGSRAPTGIVRRRRGKTSNGPHKRRRLLGPKETRVYRRTGTTIIGAAQTNAHRHPEASLSAQDVAANRLKRCETASFRVTPRDQQPAGPQFER